VIKSAARPDGGVARYSLLANLLDMSCRCAPCAPSARLETGLLSGRSRRFLHKL
jgi:hypothetical protein